MLFSAIAFVDFEAVARMIFGELLHEAVAGDFSNDRSAGYERFLLVAFDDGLLGKETGGSAQGAVEKKCMMVTIVQKTSPHGIINGGNDAFAVDGSGRGKSNFKTNVPFLLFLNKNREPLFPFDFGHLFRVAVLGEALKAEVSSEAEDGDSHRAGERSTAGFVDAEDCEFFIHHVFCAQLYNYFARFPIIFVLS